MKSCQKFNDDVPKGVREFIELHEGTGVNYSGQERVLVNREISRYDKHNRKMARYGRFIHFIWSLDVGTRIEYLSSAPTTCYLNCFLVA